MTFPRPLAAFVVAVAMVLTSSAHAASTSSIVPPGGKVAGKGYAQWLGLWWKSFLQGSTSPCGRGGRVIVLAGGAGAFTKKGETQTCMVAAGKPIYVNGLAVECSTVEKAPYHATTDAGLRRCARGLFKGATSHLTLDGVDVHTARFRTASPAFAFRLPKRNVLGAKQRNGRAAAYGDGLLLRGLSRGRHTLAGTGRLGGMPAKLTYRLTVR